MRPRQVPGGGSTHSGSSLAPVVSAGLPRTRRLLEIGVEVALPEAELAARRRARPKGGLAGHSAVEIGREQAAGPSLGWVRRWSRASLNRQVTMAGVGGRPGKKGRAGGKEPLGKTTSSRPARKAAEACS